MLLALWFLFQLLSFIPVKKTPIVIQILPREKGPAVVNSRGVRFAKYSCDQLCVSFRARHLFGTRKKATYFHVVLVWHTNKNTILTWFWRVWGGENRKLQTGGGKQLVLQVVSVYEGLSPIQAFFITVAITFKLGHLYSEITVLYIVYCIYYMYDTAVVVSRTILCILFHNAIVHTQQLSPKIAAGCVLLQGCIPLEAGQMATILAVPKT